MRSKTRVNGERNGGKRSNEEGAAATLGMGLVSLVLVGIEPCT